MICQVRRVSGSPSQARTKTETERKLQAVRRNLATGQPQLDGRLTVEDYLESWLGRVAGRVRPSTMARYRSICEHQLVPHLGAIKLARLSPENVDAMLSQLQRGGDKLSPRSASHARAVLRTAISDAMKRELVTRNSAALADPPRVPSPSPKVPTVESIHEVLAALRGSDVENVVTVSLFSGLRLGEVLALRWEDISFEAQQLTVSHSLQKRSEERRVGKEC
jgi:integrase